ncbi:MAG: rRNA-processing protein las1 [Geoglossum umbratile]|nr:MAG: rRNA-processing protein las1 [Geoglossum umbratile]
MPRAKLVLWRHHDDLLEVRAAFYPPPDGEDRRRDAVMTVRAWSVRGKVPHLIDSTSLLTEAILNDAPDTPQQVVRLAYSAAFCRFVTGLTDVALRGALHQTMYKVAKNLGLPTALVELRHAATHKQLLSLPVLRSTAQRSLEWLWSNYWLKIADSESYETDSGAGGPFDVDEFKDQLRDVLRPYKRSRRAQLRHHLPLDENETREASQVIRDSCSGSASWAFVLVDVLLETGFILPNGRGSVNEKMLNDDASLWDDILGALCNSPMPTFLPALLDGLLDRICEHPTKSIRNNMHKDSVFHWTSRILLSQEWEDKRAVANLDLESILQKCFMNPNDWTLKVASLLFSMDDSLKSNYGELACLAQIQLEANSKFSGFSMERQYGTEQMEKAETQLIADVQKEITDNEAKHLKLRKLLDQESVYEYPAEESLDVVSLLSKDSSYEEDQEGEEDKLAPARARASSTAKGWKRYEGNWTPKPIGVV